jgi:hypothetical protein
LPVTYRTLRPEEEAAVIDLWVAVLDEDRDVRQRMFADFADDPQRFARTHVAVAPDGRLLADLFGQRLEEQAQPRTVMMVRTLTPNAQPDLEATHTAPEAIFWEIDRY